MFIALSANGKIAAKNILLCICHITVCYTAYNKMQQLNDFVIHHITK